VVDLFAGAAVALLIAWVMTKPRPRNALAGVHEDQPAAVS
jgi:hypothetical protein